LHGLSSGDDIIEIVKPTHDLGLDDLLALDGVALVVDPTGNHWVKFVCLKVPPSPERPHDVSYLLTVRAANGERIAGFDNARAVTFGSGPSRQTPTTHDHRHRRGATKPYVYQDAATLLGDFWSEVDAVLRQKGVLR
jgi:hypothetical protein